MGASLLLASRPIASSQGTLWASGLSSPLPATSDMDNWLSCYSKPRINSLSFKKKKKKIGFLK
jgi:hypothetical protein